MFEDDQVFCFDIERFIQYTPSQNEFLDKELDFDGTFDDPNEFREFCVSLGRTHPDGITFKYFTEKLNFYRTHKVISSLMSKGLLQETEDEEGNFLYSLTDFGRNSIETGDFDF